MKSFHFDLGNSNDGPIGFCARIRAKTREAALERLKELLPEDVGIEDRCANAVKSSEYVRVYINPQAITVKDIDDEADDEYDEEEDDEVKGGGDDDL